MFGMIPVKKGLYAVAARCENCGRMGIIESKMGVPVHGLYECPHCECKAMRKVMQ